MEQAIRLMTRVVILYWLACGREKLGGQGKKHLPPLEALHVVHISSMMFSTSTLVRLAIFLVLLLASNNSNKSPTLHCCCSGTGKYLRDFFTTCGVRPSRSTPHSELMFHSVLPSRVLLSCWARLARYLTLVLAEVVRLATNFC